jgi:hypothetical protein
MTPRFLQLVAIRAQIDALIAAEQGELGDVPFIEGCPHPEEKRIVSHNIGQEPEFYCPDCKAFVKGPA